MSFRFGANWARLLQQLGAEHLEAAQRSLQAGLPVGRLAGARFLDVGCGSGLFSLAARRLGARVHSFDADPESVACTRELKRRYAPGDRLWTIEEGSVLDAAYMARLGEFDGVYAWGTLHHTGALWQAMESVAQRVAGGGLLWVAIYNDQGWASLVWRAVKRLYNRLPRGLRWVVLGPAFVRLWGPALLRDALRGRPLESWRRYPDVRGMSPWRDVVDWVGGYPFEVARPETVVEWSRRRGLVLLRSALVGRGHGCNEFVLARR